MENAKVGNVASFEQLYKINSGHVYCVCKRLIGNEALTSTIVKKVFIIAWLQISEFDETRTFSRWLTKITAFTVLEDLRNKSESAAGHSPTENASENILDQALNELPEFERIVFVLHDIEKLTHEEVAELLVFPVNESKKLLIKARLKLMKAIL